jgi:hypothetical protein
MTTPSTRIAYRTLSRSRDPAQNADAIGIAMKEPSGRKGDVFRPLEIGASVIGAEIGAPRAVEAVDGTATLDELVQMLRSRMISPFDLVNPGDGWLTLRDYAPLEEAAARREQADVLRRWARAGVVALGVAVLALAAWALLRLRH